MFKKLLHSKNVDLGLLILRVFFGVLMMFGHGLGKLESFNDKFHTFPDPLGISHEFSYILAVGAEFFCSLLLILGLLTRFAVIPLFINMMVIYFMVLGSAPWDKKEFALLFLVPYFALLFAGPGKYSIDHLLFGKKSN